MSTKQHYLLDVLFGLLLALAASAVFLAATAGEGVRVGDFATARHYRVAIGEVLRAGVPPRQSELLRAHLWAPGYSASSAELAEAVGYGSWRTANFQYGALAHRIAAELGVFQPPRGFWMNVLVNWAADPVRSPLGHARYSLRREVARALIDLGFADAPPNPSLPLTRSTSARGVR